MTDDLIDRLAADAKPVPRHAMRRLFLRYAAGGAAVGFAIMLVFLGVRPDLMWAMTTAAYWTKVGYAFLLLVILVPAIFTLSRPLRAGLSWWPLAVLLACLAGAAILQLEDAPLAQKHALIWGRTALVCPWLIVLISFPMLVSLIAAMRRLAPANPALAGLVAGIVSGAMGILVYSFHCPEAGIPFIAIWYTLGIAVTAVIGMIGGRILLHW
jgi:hypothetical protein